MNVKHYLLMTAFLFISMSSLFAVPAVPWPVEKVQPDGTKISVFIKGDEKVHWMESADGYTLLYDSQKYVVYARTDEQGNLTPSTIKFGGAEKPSADIPKGLHYSQSQINTMMSIWKTTDDVSRTQRATTGTLKALCILAAFSDQPFVKTQAEFDILMNQVGYNAGGAKGSVRDYYLENSYGALTIVITVVGPVTLPQPLAYYAPKNRWKTFILNAIDAADPFVDYSQFANEYGQVSNLHVIFEGYGDENFNTGQRIWSHESVLGTSPIQRDGVYLNSYSCSPELRGSSGQNITYIGVICHEMAHVLGSADFYDPSANQGPPDFVGTGVWDLMAAGSWNDNGRQPACHNPYNKIKWGWITPQLLSSPTTIYDMPASDTNPVIYKIMANSFDGECYYLDNRQQIGFDTSLPGHGLLIWHAAKTVSSYAPNEDPPLQFYPVWARSTYAVPGSTPASYGASALVGGINTNGCPFPGSSGKTAFTDTTIPQAFTWTGMGGIGKPITNITENNTNKTISFDFMAPDAVDVVNANVNLDVYPNPVSAGAPFTVITDYQGKVINIYNIDGILIKEQISQGTETQVTVSDAGVYIISVDNKHSKLIVK
ncbi:MAG: M6 family metalloprotease domain-containing protein [Paludibacter sp.]|nr:M6 family metalloprotease domain-containing protein [Paludibacter sp.]